MEKFVFALAVIFVLEGLMLALLPNLVKRMGEKLHELPINELRIMGATALAIGTAILYFTAS